MTATWLLASSSAIQSALILVLMVVLVRLTLRRAWLTIPATALVRDGDQAYAWRLRNGVLHKVSINLGDLDPRSGQFALAGGLAEGDQLLRYPTSTLRDGQAVELGSREASSSAIPESQASVTSAR